jgi:WD40 repeat protein
LGAICNLAYSPDGRWIVFGQYDGGLQHWSAISGESRPTLSVHTGGVTEVAVAPNGQWIASSSHDSTLKLWDASTGTFILTLRTPLYFVHDIAFSPDGLHLAFGGWDGKVRLWEMNASLSSIDQEGKQTSRVKKLTYSSDGQTILSLRECVVQQ